MNVIVIGCGRVGAALASRLDSEKDHVHIIDRDPLSQALLPTNFAGSWHCGNGFNRDVLDQAGIADADAFVAVTANDNTNIVAARTAKEVYRVPIVVARIYEPQRADIYRDLGITTVASVAWTVEQIHRMLLHRQLAPTFTFGNGETILVRSTIPAYLVGRALRDFDVEAEIKVVEVTHGGRSVIPSGTALAQAGDLITFAVAARSLQRLRSFLNKELGT